MQYSWWVSNLQQKYFFVTSLQKQIATEAQKRYIYIDMIISDEYPLQNETDKIIGIAIEVHKILGAGFLEIVYKDALEYELAEQDQLYRREQEYEVRYKKAILKHKFYADFVVFDSVIVKVKAKQGGIAQEDLAQAINYLKVSGCKVGLVLNFAVQNFK